MAVLQINEQLAERIAQLAATKHQSVDALLEEWLQQAEPEVAPVENSVEIAEDSYEYPAGTLGRMMETALEMPPMKGTSDISSGNHKLLENEFVEKLIIRRLDRNSHEDVTR